ncbi:TetR family transcriptional regulator [Arthrobacter sp. MYb227]|uniref:TetR/AcrR family transcriptional regulator n=1 Tax=Arthrobacter sp. MYb227 TaxID=1848601 RepID=UPI000CFC9355|nr:TetR/AcrR family transcriptional regulator [Arthrobacter sp. MYb227]PQZ96457.1 TetR family transcriptional regulator [Arthrobacter sp. MYb227]
MPREARRRQLLAAAHQVFVAHGFHGASMDEIADVAEVSKPVLYQHFPGKRELYIALLDEHMDEFSTLLSAAIASTSDNKLRVHATIHAYYEFIARDSQAFRLIFESDLLNDEHISARIEAFNAKFARGIAQVIADDTNLPSAQALLMGRALAGMAQVSARYWVDMADEVPIEEASELVSRLAWRGIGRFPKES